MAAKSTSNLPIFFIESLICGEWNDFKEFYGTILSILAKLCFALTFRVSSNCYRGNNDGTILSATKVFKCIYFMNDMILVVLTINRCLKSLQIQLFLAERRGTVPVPFVSGLYCFSNNSRFIFFFKIEDKAIEQLLEHYGGRFNPCELIEVSREIKREASPNWVK